MLRTPPGRSPRWIGPAALIAGLVSLAFFSSWFFRGDGVDRSRVYRIDYGNDLPFHFQGENGRPSGLAVDLVQAAARARNIQLEWVNEAEKLPEEKNPLRVLISIRTNLSPGIYVTEPYLQGRSSFIVASNSPLRTVSDLEGKRITHANYAIHRANLARLLANFTPVPVPGSRDAIQNLFSGSADAAFMNDYALEPTILSIPAAFSIRIIPSGAPPNRMALASRPEFAHVADVLRDAIREMAFDGSMDQIVDRWGFFSNLTTDRRDELIKERRKLLTFQTFTAVLLLTLAFSAWLIFRLRTEKQLARTAERIQTATLDALPAHIALLDSAGVIIGVNQAWRTFCTPNQLLNPAYQIGQNYLHLCESAPAVDSARAAAGGLRNVLEGRQNHFTLEYPCHSPSEQSWFRLVVAPMNPDRRSGAVVMHLNITERKRSELALLASEQKARAIIECTPVPMAINDDHQRITFLNHAFTNTFGYTLDDIPTLDDWWPKAYPDPAYRSQVISSWATELDRARATRTAFQPIELRVRARDGSDRVVLAAASFFQDPAQREHLVALFDITERKLAEEALRQSEAQILRVQRMESIGTLAGGIAHDLNNALTPIVMSLELLFTEEKDPAKLNLLETLRTSAQHGASLIRQLLTFARGVEGQRVPVNPASLARDVHQMIRDTFPKNIRFVCTLPSEPWTVTGDPTQLNQVLMNLCVNARDVMPGGGTLTLKIENTLLDQSAAAAHPRISPGPSVIITVSDTGPGIPEHLRDTIFEPFYTTKAFGKGTGLGLSTSLAIIKSHRGTLTVESELGLGAHFKICLPATATSTPLEPAAPQPPSPSGGGECILVVDDEESIRKLAQATLQRFGYRVLCAAHGREAVEIYSQRQSEINLVLTDMAMPIMDGPAAINALRQINPRIKIIGMSGSNPGAIAGNQPASLLRYFIPKPYSTQTMLETVRACLDDKSNPA